MKAEWAPGIKPNFSEAYSKANEVLVRSKIISSFPYSPFLLVKELSPYVCRSYAKAREYGVDMTNFGSESAIIMKIRNRIIIFYDETKPASHIRFSILHEFGHPELGHSFCRVDELTYGRYEIETNFFAAQLLMPEQLLRELQKRGVVITVPFLVDTFGVSKEAAEKRIRTIDATNNEWRSKAEREFDDIILHKYAAFLDSIRPLGDSFNFEHEYEMQRIRNSWY